MKDFVENKMLENNLVEVNQYFKIQVESQKNIFEKIHPSFQNGELASYDSNNLRKQLSRIKTNSRSCMKKPQIRIDLSKLLFLNICEICKITSGDLLKQLGSDIDKQNCEFENFDPLLEINEKLDRLIAAQEKDSRDSLQKQLQESYFLGEFIKTEFYTNVSGSTDNSRFSLEALLLSLYPNMTPVFYLKGCMSSEDILLEFLNHISVKNRKYTALVSKITDVSLKNFLLNICFQRAYFENLCLIFQTISKNQRPKMEKLFAKNNSFIFPMVENKNLAESTVKQFSSDILEEHAKKLKNLLRFINDVLLHFEEISNAITVSASVISENKRLFLLFYDYFTLNSISYIQGIKLQPKSHLPKVYKENVEAMMLISISEQIRVNRSYIDCCFNDYAATLEKMVAIHDQDI